MNFMEILNTLALFCMLFATGTHSFLECREPTFLYNNRCVTAKEACPDVQTTYSIASKTCVQCPSGYSNPDYFTDRCLTPINPSIVKEKVPEVSLKPTPATPINSPTPLIPTSTLQPEVINGDASPSGKPDEGFSNNKSASASVDLAPPHTITTTIENLVTQTPQTPKDKMGVLFWFAFIIVFAFSLALLIVCSKHKSNKKYQNDTKKLADADSAKLMNTDETPV